MVAPKEERRKTTLHLLVRLFSSVSCLAQVQGYHSCEHQSTINAGLHSHILTHHTWTYSRSPYKSGVGHT
jgi:hypothetical protein